MAASAVWGVALPDLAATAALARQLAPLLQTGDVLALSGELGAGKTSFARAVLHSLGVTGEVPSPTFTLVQSYELTQFTVSHFDLYRLTAAAELDELGWDDALASSLALVEWPERASARLPATALQLHFTTVGMGRRCDLTMPPVWAARLAGLRA